MVANRAVDSLKVLDLNRPTREAEVVGKPSNRRLSSRPEGFHLRALPEPYVNLSTSHQTFALGRSIRRRGMRKRPSVS